MGMFIDVPFPSSASGMGNVSISRASKRTVVFVQPSMINAVSSMMGLFPEWSTTTTIGSHKPVLRLRDLLGDVMHRL